MRIRKLAGTLVNALLYLALAGLLILTVPRIAGFQCYTVISGSMEPAIPVGSIAYVKECEPENIKKGDVITFLVGQDGTKVTHRVTETDYEKRIFVTKGDANQAEDPAPVSWENVCGVLAGSLPLAGYLLDFLGDWRGKAAAAAYLGFLCLVSELLAVGKWKKGE